jgi:hypothetical protein
MPLTEQPETLSSRWKEYRDKVYPTGIPADQNRECHQAFMAGALEALTILQVVSGDAETEAQYDAAAKRLSEVYKEALEWSRLRCVALNSPRN